MKVSFKDAWLKERIRQGFRRSITIARYALSTLWIALWALFAQLPWGVQKRTAQGLAWCVYRLNIRRCQIARRNLELCFPEYSEQERERLLQQNLFHTLMGGLESGMAWFWPKWRLRSRVQLDGKEHIDALEGQGALLVSPHFTSLEMAGVCANTRLDCFDMMYRPDNNPLFDWVQRVGRGRHNRACVMLDRRDVRTTLKRLKKGRVVWYAPDQDYGRSHSVFAPFFGVPAASVTATARYAHIAKVPVLLFFYERLDNGTYRAVIKPIEEAFPAGDDVACATQVNRWMESLVQQCPEQYLWVHRRFKTRPEGQPSLY